MCNDIKIIEVVKNDNLNYEFSILGKLNLELTREETLDLFWQMAKELEYETRSKW